MAFICTAVHSAYHFDVFRRGDSHAITFPVGYDDVEDINYFAMVGLDSMPPGELKYYFCLLEVDGSSKTERMIWSGKDLPGEITESDRRVILEIILIATESLLKSVAPERVFRCTHDANMPDKALEKHHEISQVFIRCGYLVHTADSFHGKRTWWMERQVASERFDATR